jgi:hypothetical protein
LEQKRAPGANSDWQLVQRALSLAPQLKQNLAPAGFSVWQLGHFIEFSSPSVWRLRV